ncbi:MAG: response regulator receiver modulated metal dependent phosphohydrolase [Chloroflexi bacterium OLB15]|nr:MAG: response regulator receiver modulated metal dependent phosphohydrolase [Chloroflexi bacterium OLB15]
MTLLYVVDDDPDVLDAIGRVLKSEGYLIDLLPSGALLLDSLERRVPDLVILDIMMPEMDGITVCRRLREDPRYISLPVVFFNG